MKGVGGLAHQTRDVADLLNEVDYRGVQFCPGRTLQSTQLLGHLDKL